MKRLSVTAVISMINRMQVQEERIDADATPAISRQQTSSDQGTRIIVSLGIPVHFYFYAKAQLVRMFTNIYRKVGRNPQARNLLKELLLFMAYKVGVRTERLR